MPIGHFFHAIAEKLGKQDLESDAQRQDVGGGRGDWAGEYVSYDRISGTNGFVLPILPDGRRRLNGNTCR